MNEWFEILIVLTISGSAIVLCIQFLNLITMDIFSAKWQYQMRKLANFFFLVPVWIIVQRFILLFTESNSNIMMVSHWQEIIPQQYLSMELSIYILSTWGIGVAIFGGWHIYCYLKFSKELKKSDVPIKGNHEVYRLLDTCKEKMKIRRNIKLVYNDKIASPALVGLIKPKILLPIRKFSTVELKMVFHHELIHYKQKDIWMKMFMLVVSSVHWFNPLVHILRKEAHIWSEFACDEEVVTNMSYVERKKYGEMILTLLEDSIEQPTLYSTFLSGNKNILKKRLTMLLKVRPKKKFMLAMMTVLIISTGAVGVGVSMLAERIPIKIDSSKNKPAIFNPNDQKTEDLSAEF